MKADAKPAPALPADAAVAERMARCHEAIWARFVHPDVDLVYDYIAPPGTPEPWAHLPTAEEVAAETPNACGWGAGMEDCAINGGAYTACMLDAHAATGREEYAEKARRLCRGLRTLGTVGEREGFVARGVLPGDGRTHYPNTSADQVTWFVYGLWRYATSPVATDAERREIADILDAACRRVAEDGFTLLRDDAKPGLVGEIGVIRSDRSSRLLALYAAGHALTGRDRWAEIYREKLSENRHARLADVATPSRVEYLAWGCHQAVYGVLQNQVSLVVLEALERDFRTRACYVEAMRGNAAIVAERSLQFREYSPEIHCDAYELGGWRTGGAHRPECIDREFGLVRAPAEAMVVMLLAHGRGVFEPARGPLADFDRDRLAGQCRELLSTYDYDRLRLFAILYCEWAYWLAVRRDMFRIET